MKIQDIVRLGLLLILGIGVFLLVREPAENAGGATTKEGASTPVKTVDFKFLARTKIDSESASSKVDYPEDMAALDNQRISIVGFMAPFEEIDNMKRFMLLPSYVGCYFCAPPSFTQVLLVEQKNKSKDKLPFIDDPIQVTGTLRLYSKDSQHPAHKAEFVYALDDTEVSVYKGADAPKKPAAATPPRKLGSAPATPAPATTAATPHKAFQPQFLVASVSDLRKLPMLKPMKFEAVAPAEIERRMKERVAASLTAEGWKGAERALLALDFIEGGIDLQRAITGLELARSPGIYDAKTDTMFYNSELQFSKPEARVEMVKLITDALLAQNVTLPPLPPLSLDDATLAAAALYRGDIERTAKLYDQNTRLLSGAPAPPLTPHAGYPAVPEALLKLFETPRVLGLPLVEKAFPAAEIDKTNAAYAKPPATTATLLRGTYPAESAVPAVIWPNEVFGDAKPIFGTTLGEATLAIWSKADAGGWNGDRFAIWDGGVQGDIWIIETHWKDQAAAKRFFASAEAKAGGSSLDQDQDTSETTFAGQFKGRPFRVYLDDNKVFVIGAGTAEQADVLAKQFVMTYK